MVEFQASAAPDVVSAVAYTVAVVQATKAEAGNLLRRRAPPAKRGWAGGVLLARTAATIPAPWLLEAVRVDDVSA